MTVFTEHIDIPVAGGDLHVGAAGDPDAPVVVAVHGITGNHHVWATVVRRVRDHVRVLAPDLRGRGGSAGLPGPFGMAAHAADLVAVLDHAGVERAVVAGHSMGAFVAATFAASTPDRASAVVLVDGGLPIAAPPGLDPDVVIDAVLGPAIARLRQEFASVDDYIGFWRAHPAFAGSGVWDDDIEAWIRSDLTGEPPALRSVVAEDAVRSDGAELVVNAKVREAAEHVKAPVRLLRATLGLLDEPNPLLPEAEAMAFADRHDNVDLHTLTANHYTILLGDGGATAVADSILRSVDR